jgi:hypothetical protein
MLELFIAEVVPILQRRGLFRTACTGETPMATYQLAWPDTRFGQLPSAATFTRI